MRRRIFAADRVSTRPPGFDEDGAGFRLIAFKGLSLHMPVFDTYRGSGAVVAPEPSLTPIPLRRRIGQTGTARRSRRFRLDHAGVGRAAPLDGLRRDDDAVGFPGRLRPLPLAAGSDEPTNPSCGDGIRLRRMRDWMKRSRTKYSDTSVSIKPFR